MTPSEEILSRYSKTERVPDSLGRIIGVKRLKPSQQLMVEEMVPGQAGNAMPLLVAAVVEIDDAKIPFPRSRGELNAMMDRLDSEGLTAAAAGWRKLHGIEEPVEGEDGETKPEPESELDAAKK